MNLGSEFADPWGDVLDLESLHSLTTRAIQHSVKQLRELAIHQDHHSARPLPMVVLGAAGSGKTHLFARLRRQFQSSAILVHIRPLLGWDMTPRYILGQIMEQLAFSSGGHRQLDTLAGAILAQALDGDPACPQETLDLLKEIPDGPRRTLTNHILESHLTGQPDLDEAYFSWILRLPFLPFLSCKSALTWLGGRELDEIQASRLGVRGGLPNARIQSALKTLAHLAAPHAPLVLVFDQLENLVGASQRHITAYANLIMELVDVARDVVIVQMALVSEWEQLRKQFSTSQQDRIEGLLLHLSPPNRKEAEGLLRLWTSSLPFPLPYPWPFTPKEAESLCSAGTATPRILLKELRRALESSEAPQVGLADLLHQVWMDRLAWARQEVDQSGGPEPAFLMDGLFLLIKLMPEFRLPVNNLQEDFLDIERHGTVIRIAPMLHANANALTAVIKRLEPFQGHVLALREKWRDFKPTWKGTVQAWRSWVLQPNVQWHWLLREDTVRLLALDSFHKNAASMDISDPDGEPVPLEKVMEWIQRELHYEDWPITLALHGELEKDTIALEDTTPAHEAHVLQILQQLRCASLERLQRECGFHVKRAQIFKELHQAGQAVRWIGDSLVCLSE